MFRIDNPNHKHVWGVQTLLLGDNLQDSLGSWRSIPSSRVITQCLVLILGIVPVPLLILLMRNTFIVELHARSVIGHLLVPCV